MEGTYPMSTVVLDTNFLPLPTRCTARAKSRIRICNCEGNRYCEECRCRNDAIPGGAVCIFHGGKAPQVALAANRRIVQQLEDLTDGVATILAYWKEEQLNLWKEAIEKGMPGPLMDPKGLTAVLVALDNQHRLNMGKATDITESRHIDAAETIRALDDQFEQIRSKLDMRDGVGGVEDAEEVEGG